MTAYWEKIILARWSKRSQRSLSRACRLALPLLLTTLATAADLSETHLGQGINAYNIHDYGTAIQHLRGLGPRIPKLSDYVAYYLASSEMQLGEVDNAARDLTAYRANAIAASPLAGKLSLLDARALLAEKTPTANTAALDVLQKDYSTLPQPDGDFALGMAYEGTGEKLQAALSYVKVYYNHPNTPLAAQAWDAIQRLRESLGKDFPVAPALEQLDRCRKWLDAKQYNNARAEYSALANSLPEPDRDEAKVGIGATDFLAGDTAASLRYLKPLHVSKSESDAERLYYITEASRKMGDDVEMMAAVKTLNEKYPKSTWRLKALLSAGNKYLDNNDQPKYEPLFRAASDSFPDDPSAATSHWHIAWDAYLADKPEAAELLHTQIERYPADTRTSSALYFLGRWDEKAGKPAEARALYEQIDTQYPHYFYAILARERLHDPKIAAMKADATTAFWLSNLDWPEHRDFTSTEPNPATRLRIDRARLLMLSGFPDLADTELRFGAKKPDEQPHLLALELARAMPTPFHALRIMKSFIGDYLSIPFEQAPLRFWQTLFPLPYKDDVVRNAKSHDLDPYSVAALIRQETEFNPDAHSYANAYGLMQLIPATGRLMGRQTGITISSTRTLLNPAINIQLGTQYLRSQLNNWNGDWAETLAAYNAGPGRVKQWLTWANYREPAEFVESIPFTQTREYVQAVLRNADMYRTIYGEKHPNMPDVKEASDIPPVNLSTLPVAARTPGGGVRTVSASSKSRVRRPAAKKSVATKKAKTKKKRPA